MTSMAMNYAVGF